MNNLSVLDQMPVLILMQKLHNFKWVKILLDTLIGKMLIII